VGGFDAHPIRDIVFTSFFLWQNMLRQRQTTASLASCSSVAPPMPEQGGDEKAPLLCYNENSNNSYEWGFEQTMKVLARASFLILILMFPLRSQAADVSLTYLSDQTVFFAQQEISLRWQPTDVSAWQGVQQIQARFIFANKTVLQQNFSPAFPLEFTFQYPEIRPGVIIAPVLVLSASMEDGTIVEVDRQQFYFYPASLSLNAIDPGLEIGVFDQTEEQALTAFMEDWGIPYIPLMDFSDFDGAWIICAGLDFEQSPSLFEELQVKFDQGLSILILPPWTGEFSLPAYRPDGRLVLASQGIIQDFNKTWNIRTARPGSPLPFIRFLPAQGDDRVVIKQTDRKNGYHWLSHHAGSQAMVVLGWDVMSLSETNPVAALLFQYVLTEINKNRGKK
jgi:hypothetical protein